MQPIATVKTPFTETGQIPKGPLARDDGKAYAIWLFDRVDGCDLTAWPPSDDRPHGLFATRSPRRPNPRRLTVAELLRRDRAHLHVRGVDMLDGSPVLDIKPSLSSVPLDRLRRGWFSEAEGRRAAR